jgi:methionine-gamma-lyase
MDPTTSEDVIMPHQSRLAARRKLGDRELHPESLMMSYGYDAHESGGSVKCPIFQTSTFAFDNAEAGKEFFEAIRRLRQDSSAADPGLIYSRINNPDLEVLENRLTLWDGAEAALAFGSGMAAIATTILTFLRPGDVIVHSNPLYGGSEWLIQGILTQFGIEAVGFAAGRSEDLERALQKAGALGQVGLILVETPANPTNDLVDLQRCVQLAETLTDAEGNRPLVAVDNTFLGPLWQQPLQHGADLVLYSLTKYVGGHSDLIAGACLGSHELIRRIRGFRSTLGTTCDVNTSWMLMRSLETLKVRMTTATRNARYVAEFLAAHPKVLSVGYLGFLSEEDPQREIYRRQCLAPGSTFSFVVDGGEARAFRLLNELKLIKLAVSLGGTESLAEHPASMTHSDYAPEELEELGITDGLVRISVGLEHPEDLIADLEQALEAVTVEQPLESGVPG